MTTSATTATFDVISSKRDTRAYSDRPIPDGTLHRILQAGRMAGSSKNAQPCRFVVLRDQEHKRELAACGDFAQHLPSAPVVVAVVLLPDGGPFDAGRAAQNMMVAAWAEGGAKRTVAILFWVKKSMPSLPWTLLVPR